MSRARSWHFYITGAIGGLFGFGLMELVRIVVVSESSGYQASALASSGELLSLALQFSAFGLAVGAALGVTEGLVQRRIWRAAYGLVLGAILGLVGGFIGGGLGQGIFSLLPTPSPPPPAECDVAIVLDASGSMTGPTLFGFSLGDGSDPKLLRVDASRRLISKLGDNDRVAVVDFADTAQVLHPLESLDTQVRRRVDQALGGTVVRGGTNLTAGLQAGLAELSKSPGASRKQFLIFLTDGDGFFDPRVIQPAIERGVQIFTIGLGPEVQSSLLEHQIARPTGGSYFPVAAADKLLPTFETIYEQATHVDMAGHDEDAGTEYPKLFMLLRVLSWGAMGLVIGFGQGIRENTREDLRACSLGGFFGGLVGGVLFDPVTGAMGTVFLGRMAAETVVGACIGGSMRWAQGRLVERRAEQTTTLLTSLPRRSTWLVATRPAAGPLTEVPARGARGLVLRIKDAVERSDGADRVVPERQPVDSHTATPESTGVIQSESRATTPHRDSGGSARRPVSFYEQRFSTDRGRAMATAFRAGYSIEEIAAHFRVRPARVEQAVHRDGESRR
ncbi:MAG: VWA domain-containing protein [Thermoanaerobaculia bacterium]|nr:VWA domain-containing protein [Thermoanaerobaculia bacterium]